MKNETTHPRQENQLECPACKSTDIENLKKGALVLAVGCLAGAIILYFVFPYIKVVAALAILGVLCLIMYFRKGDNYLCRSCKHKFNQV